MAGKTQFFIIPNEIDKELKLEVNEKAYIIQENLKPTQIIFARQTKKGKTIIHISKVENYSQKQKLFHYDYAIVKAPQTIIPPQSKCQKLMFIEDEKEDFLIILR